MAKSISKSQRSLIAMLAQSRALIFGSADRDNSGILDIRQMEQVNALNLIIAVSEPTSRKDAAVQVGIAREMVELFGEGYLGASALEAAHTALVSASLALGGGALRRAA